MEGCRLPYGEDVTHYIIYDILYKYPHLLKYKSLLIINY